MPIKIWEEREREIFIILVEIYFFQKRKRNFHPHHAQGYFRGEKS